MSKMKIFLAVLAALAMATPALALDVTLHGDFNNRFNLYTNQSQVYTSYETVKGKPIQKDDNTAFWGDTKYRLWTEAATNDGAVKAVYAIELGALRFGNGGSVGKSVGGGYSGDGVNIETRWAYTDFQLPGVASKARVQIGLFPWKVNSFVWNETAMGVQLKGDTGSVAYTLGWARGKENLPTATSKNAFQDADAFLVRGDLKPAAGTKLGLFALWQRQDAFDGTGGLSHEIKGFGNDQYNIYTLGVDGGLTSGNLFVNWDAIYQGGTIEKGGPVNSMDVSGFLVHGDVGMNIDRLRLTYTGWYASGDDNPNDDKIDNFMSTDVDRFDSVVFFEGGYTDDNYFTEAPYILDKGLILNKVAADYKATEKTSVGGALLYLMTAEDLANGESNLGTEIDAYVSHKLYPNVEVALNAGYLVSDDGMKVFSATGDKEDLFRVTSRVRYKF